MNANNKNCFDNTEFVTLCVTQWCCAFAKSQFADQVSFVGNVYV